MCYILWDASVGVIFKKEHDDYGVVCASLLHHISCLESIRLNRWVEVPRKCCHVRSEYVFCCTNEFNGLLMKLIILFVRLVKSNELKSVIDSIH